ncbi:MAG: O-antigen ligase family protein, partial [Fusobacteriaceae bacterium]
MIYIVMLIGVEKYRMIVMPFAIVGLFLSYLKKRKFETGNLPILISYIIILIVGYIFNLLSISGVKGGEYFLILNTIFVFPFIFLNFVNSSKNLFAARTFLIVSGVILGSVSIYQYIWRYYSSDWNTDVITSYRSSGFENIFYTSVFLMVTGIIVVSKLYIEKLEWKTGRERAVNILYILSAIIIFQGLLFTKTRASIYTFFAGFILILISKLRVKKALVFIMSLFILYGVNPIHVKSITETVTVNPNKEGPRQHSDNLRRIMWRGAYNIWKEHPILGVGNDIDVVREKMSDYSKKIEDESGDITYGIKGEFFRSKFTESHSTYFNFLMQNGIVILLYLFFFAIVIPYQFWKN